MAIVASGIMDLIQQICKDTSIEYCPLTDNYLLYHRRLDENYIVESDFFEETPGSSLSLVIYWFDAEGSEGAKKALKEVKKKSSPLWRALHDSNKDS
jgi:hypothetical protein